MPIRMAFPDEFPVLLPLLRGYTEFYESNPSDAGLEAMVASAIAAPDDQAFLLVATDDDEVVGFANCQWKWSSLKGERVVVLDDLYVREEARGEGHADALIAASGDVARQHGATVLTWFTQQTNHRAQKVYNRVGGVSEPLLEYELEL
ncbi:hypothetical protein BH10ACT11_BH10ACT11_09030 [soil metagenome]